MIRLMLLTLLTLSACGDNIKPPKNPTPVVVK
jgi:hypothetical protein